MAAAKRRGCRIILDRPGQDVAGQFKEWVGLEGVAAALDIIGVNEDDALRIVPLAPPEPRAVIAVNGAHSEHEALAFDLHLRGVAYDEIGRLMGCDTQTAKTYIIRARLKNMRNRQMEEAIRLCSAELPER